MKQIHYVSSSSFRRKEYRELLYLVSFSIQFLNLLCSTSSKITRSDISKLYYARCYWFILSSTTSQLHFGKHFDRLSVTFLVNRPKDFLTALELTSKPESEHLVRTSNFELQIFSGLGATLYFCHCL